MVLFKSPHPDIDIPTDLTTWEWLFEGPQHSRFHSQVDNTTSPTSSDSLTVTTVNPLSNEGPGAYINPLSHQSLPYPLVARYATILSTILIQSYGLGPGTTVTIFSSNTIWYPVALWAVIRAGGLVNGANPAYTVEEMTDAMRTAGTGIVFSLPGEGLRRVLRAAEEVGLDSGGRVLLLEGQGATEGVRSIQELIRVGQREGVLEKGVPKPYSITQGKTNKDVCGFLNFSSGTTGRAKAVMISHRNVIAQCMQLKQIQAPDPDRYKILAAMPLFHITGLIRFIIYPPYMNGHSIMLPPPPHIPTILSIISTYHIKELILVPPLILSILHHPSLSELLPQLRHIERFSSGSAPIAPETVKLLGQKFPWTGFRQGYGATESTACITAHDPGWFDYKWGASGGRLVAGTVAKVMEVGDENGVGPGPRKELGVNEVGEILAQGPQIVMGYLGDEKATRETFDQDGFLHTGDVGYFDENGLIYIVDRIKEMIKVKGQQVAPAELEDLLLGHPAVEDACVVAVRDDRAGERPKGFVVIKKGVQDVQLDREAVYEIGRGLLRYVKEKKIRYKWIREVEFVDQIPKSPTGKLLRRILKERERKRMEAGSDDSDAGGVRIKMDEIERERAKL